MAKKILFVGAGAVGSYIGAFLSRAGHDVTLIDAWAEQVEALRRQGIAVSGPHDPFTAHPKAVHLHEAQRLPCDFDIVFIALKVYDTAWAAQLALRHAARRRCHRLVSELLARPDRSRRHRCAAHGRPHHGEDRCRAVETRRGRARRGERSEPRTQRVPRRRA